MVEGDNSLKTLARGAGLVFFGMIISKLLTYIYRIIIARIGTEDYGLISLGIAFFGFISLISSFGMQTGLLKFVSYYKSTGEKHRLIGIITSAITFQLIVSVLFAVLGFVFAGDISTHVFHNTGLTNILRVFTVAIPFGVLGLSFLSVTNAFEKAEYDVISRSFLETFLKLAGTIVLVALGAGVMGAAYAYAGATIVAFFAALYFLLKVLKGYRIRWKTYGRFREVFNYSWPLLLSGFMTFVYLWTDTFMLGYFKDVTTVGIYNVALPTANLLYMFPFGLMALFIPVITSIHIKNDKKTFRSVYQSTTKWILLFNSLIFIALLFFGKSIIQVLFGDSYLSGYSALVLLACGYFIAYSMHNSVQLLLVYKKTRLMFINTFISGSLNVALNFFLIPKYGLIGAAIATSCSYSFLGIVMAVQTYRITKIFPFKTRFVKIPLVAFLAGVVGLLIKSFFDINLIILLGIFVIISIFYLFLLFMFKIFDKNDILVINALQGKIGFSLHKLEKFFKKFM